MWTLSFSSMQGRGVARAAVRPALAGGRVSVHPSRVGRDLHRRFVLDEVRSGPDLALRVFDHLCTPRITDGPGWIVVQRAVSSITSVGADRSTRLVLSVFSGAIPVTGTS